MRRIPVTGGTAEVVVAPEPQAFLGAFTLVGADLVVSEVDTQATVPIANGTKRRVFMVPAAGGARSLLGERTGDGAVQDLVLAGADVVWRDDSGVFSTPLAGGDTAALPAAPLPANYVYRSILPAGGTIYCSAISLQPGSPGFVAPLAGGDVSGLVSLPIAFAADDTFIYWSQASGQLTRAPLAGGSLEVIAGGFASRPRVALGGDRLYGAAGPVVKQVGLEGGAPLERLLTDGAVLRLAADAEAAYALTLQWNLWRIPAVGGAPERISQGLGPVGRVRVAGGYVYWNEALPPPSLGDAIYRMPTGGGDRALVIDGTSGVEDLIVTGGFVYFKELGGGIARVPVGGGARESLTGAMWGPMVLAADGTYLFAANGTDVFKLPLAGGAIVPLFGSALIGPNALAVDATSVYWTDSYYEAVLRLTPK